jgi:ABC-type arginine transport system ATPase subunit
MAKIILNCRYFKSGKNKKSVLSNLVKYIATRDGVQKIEIKEENFSKIQTERQQQLIKQLEKNYGMIYTAPEYEDYKKEPTQKNASEYINALIDNHFSELALFYNLHNQELYKSFRNFFLDFL